MSPPKPTASATSTTTTRTNFPSITACDVSSINHHSIAADLDGTLLISRSSFPYFMLVAIEAGSFLRGLALLLSFPLIAIAYTFLSEALAIQMLIFISFSGLKIRDIELASRAVLTKFHAADVNSESWEVFDKCERKVVVTANPTVMVEHFVREYLGGHTVLGTEIEVNPKTKRVTGFVKKPGVLVGKLKKLAVLKEFGDESPDIGIGDRQSDHDFMSCCKGVLLGLSNTAGVLAGVFGTAATGYILQKGSWDDVFKVSVALYIIGTLVWNIFSTGRRDAAYISKEIKQ